MPKQKKFRPNWFEGFVPENSYRSLFKWGGADNRFKHPHAGLYRLLKEKFHLSDADFRKPGNPGLTPVHIRQSGRLKKKQLAAFARIVGIENVRTDGYTRLSVAYGKTMLDLFRLRNEIAENLPDAVLYPRTALDVERIVRFCTREGIPVYVYGGGSSVTRGAEAVRGGVTLDTRVHLNRILSFNETDQTITVQPGLTGPALEAACNSAPELFGAKDRYTCGHFPQSFEYSCVGGWVVTRGAGQNSTYYGKIEDLVVCQEYVTPAGTLRTGYYPARATGPDIDQIMMGSEGAYGVLVSVTLRIFRHRPENRRRFSFLFRNWRDAQSAAREIMQGEFGSPSVFRISDPEETDVAFVTYGLDRTPLDGIMSFMGYRKNSRCLMLGTADGEKRFTKTLFKNIWEICRGHGALPASGLVTRAWERGRFTDPYLRDDLMDFGIVTDTLECAVTWESLPQVYERVRAVCKRRPRSVCMTHMSHCYPQGANLYFIFIARMDGMKDYLDYQTGILEAICRSGAAMSHHHGIGKMTAPWLERQLGRTGMGLLRALKRHLDPAGIMNPGGTLALDKPAGRTRPPKRPAS